MALPGDKLPELSFWQFIPFFDKWVHLAMFFILSSLLYFGFFKQVRFRWLKSNPLIITLIISVLYAGFTEIIQNFVSLRTSDFYDFVADFVGCITGATIFKVFLHKYYNRKSQKAN